MAAGGGVAGFGVGTGLGGDAFFAGGEALGGDVVEEGGADGAALEGLDVEEGVAADAGAMPPRMTFGSLDGL